MKNEKDIKNIEKPLEMAMEDARRDIVQAINNIANENNLSYYFKWRYNRDCYFDGKRC